MRFPICRYGVAGIFIVMASGAWADGQAVYNQNCGVCHNNISPKLGDKAAWAPRIKQGSDVLLTSVTKGKGMMPSRAGHANLSDDDIKAAIEYIESKSQ